VTESGVYVKRSDGQCGHYNGRNVCTEKRGHSGSHAAWTDRLNVGRVQVRWTSQTVHQRSTR
jgi:hypothetical protein